MKNKASSIGFKIIMPVVLVITIGAVFLMTSVMLNVTSHWTENTRERVENDRKIVLSLMNQKIQFADKGAKYAKQIIEEDLPSVWKEGLTVLQMIFFIHCQQNWIISVKIHVLVLL